MPIPYRLNPMGKNEKKYFELVVKPGILAAGMTYGFTPYWNSGGYCSVDWGDGQKKDAVTSGTALNHTYAKAGTYTVKVKAECYRVNFNTTGNTLIESCSESLDNLGDLTIGDQMFSVCSNALLKPTRLPDSITNAQLMFHYCSNAELPLTKLPDRLTNGSSMFHTCPMAQLPLTKLPDGLTNGYNMFSGCKNAELPLISLGNKLSEAKWMFAGCSNARLPLTSLPSSLKNAEGMFGGCTNAEINLDTLVANAPAEGWTKLTNIANMFNGCSKVIGSRSAFLAKCPANVTGADTAFTGTNTTE